MHTSPLYFYVRLVFVHLPILALRIRPKGIQSAVHLYIQLLGFLISRKLWCRGKKQQFMMAYKGVSFSLELRNPSDIAPLVELYVGREYEYALPGSPQIIIDLGANYGDSALYFHARFPDAHIYAVEAAPDSFAQLVQNTEQCRDHVTPIHAYVGDRDGETSFYINMSMGSLGNARIARGGEEQIVVPSYTLSSLCALHGIQSVDLIKFDVEGAESDIFKNETDRNLARTYIGEVHEDLMNIPKDDFLKLFSEYTVALTQLRNPHRSIMYATKR